MQRGKEKYTNQELIKQIIWNTIPEAWQHDFEMFDGLRATTIQQVQSILQKVEWCENLEKRTEKTKEFTQKNRKETRTKVVKSESTLIHARNLVMTTNGTTVLITGRTRRKVVKNKI